MLSLNEIVCNIYTSRMVSYLVNTSQPVYLCSTVRVYAIHCINSVHKHF